MKRKKFLDRARFSEEELHGHPHHAPVEIDIIVKVRRRYPVRTSHKLRIAGAIVDTSPTGGTLDEGDMALAVEKLWPVLRDGLLKAMNDRTNTPGIKDAKSYAFDLPRMEDKKTH